MIAHKAQLAQRWIKLTVLGSTSKNLDLSAQEELERDGRRRRKVLNDLCTDGYLNLVDGKYQITAKAYNEIKAEKPDLAALVVNDTFGIPSGANWTYLPMEAQKYIIEHKDEYSFFMESDYSDKTQTPYEFGVITANFRYFSLKVKDAAFSEAREKAVFAKEIEKARKRNFAWGFEKLGIIEEGDEIYFKSDDPFKSGVFKDDPENWSQDLENEIQRIQKKIESAQKRQEVLSKVHNKIAEHGGWGKFLAEYDELILAELTKEKEEAVNVTSN